MCSRSLQFVASSLLVVALACSHPTMPENGSTLSTNHNELQRQLQQPLREQYDNIVQNASRHNTPMLPHKSYDIIDDVYEAADVEDADDDNTVDTGYEYAATSKSRSKRALSDWFIAPNTRWCGRGNTAGTYNNLGGASSADKCCRKHDHCQVYIAGMSNRYDLFNYRPYTLSHCSCDQRFRTCLKMANDEASISIGKIFFNMVQTQCFVLKNENTCLERDENGKHCIKERVKQKAYLRNNRKF